VTPDDLRKLADEATPTGAFGPVAGWGKLTPQARLNLLAPDLARLCAELGEALWEIEAVSREDADLSEALSTGEPYVNEETRWIADRASAALAKLAELEARTR